MFSFDHLDVLRAAEIEVVASLVAPGLRLLEVGAGTGTQALELERRGLNVTAIEMADSAYAAHRVFPIRDYDGRTFPLPDACVDVVFSSNVLEHVPDLPRLHEESRRVLVPGGRCIHVLPTHAWRFWTTVTSYPDAALYFLSALPQLVPGSWRGREPKPVSNGWYWTVRRIGGRLIQRRHGAHGNLVSETWRFRPSWWRRHFAAHGFTVDQDFPVGLFYTGNMLLGRHLGLQRRRMLARRLGSACHLFVLR